MLSELTLFSSEKLRTLEVIAKEIVECKKCRLWYTRNRAVPGDGNSNADVMLIGEAPGYNEDLEGRPFVGAAGKLLDKLLSIAGIVRNEAYITNVVKCRPPSNRDPLPDEIDACSVYLDRQVMIISPKLIVCLGKHSTDYVLRRGGAKARFRHGLSMIAVRGQVFSINYQGLRTLAIPTYHPAAALYNPKIKEDLIEDFKTIGRVLMDVRGGRLT